ncbi:MAG: PL29 family lyase N-terminal domain-containing protein [Candidatus Cryptobacteroides sp.]
MKTIFRYMTICAAFFFVSCSLNDLKKDVDSLKYQVGSLEAQVELLNSNIEALNYILNPQNVTVESVATLSDGKFVLSLSDGRTITLTTGKPGTVDAPSIGIGEDGCWYVNGESTGVRAVGEDGKNGDGYPEFRVYQGSWQVRFGGGEWTPVEGGENVASGSLGDMFFESASVDGDCFSVVMADGKEYTLPIVSSLECAIDKSALKLTDGVLSVDKDTYVTIGLKAIGDEIVCNVPSGWRAVLTPLDNVDANGNNYTISLYAPLTKTVIIDNSTDLNVCVRKGTFWAVDHLLLNLVTE